MWINLKRVQRLALGIVSKFRQLPYKKRLTHLKLFSLQRRCQGDDLISTFRIINGFDKVDVAHFPNSCHLIIVEATNFVLE